LQEEGKASFWAYRRYMRPTMKVGWWQHEVANELHRFYRRVVNGERPKLVLQAPPQHGKSEEVRDFVSWVAGKNPNLNVIFTSYSDELCSTANVELQRMFLSPRYRKVFNLTRVRQAGERNIEGARRNTGLIEYIGHKGSFRNTTVEGQITGFGLDIGVIDDPIKGWAEAQSKAVRDRTWNWVINDFYSRFADLAGVIIIATRWHVDDPIGRWLEKFPDTKVLSFAAIAENADDWTVRAGFRRVGEALFPEHKTLEFLRLRQKVMTEGSWQALYQQMPIISGGGVIPIEKLRVLPYFDRKQVQRSVRYFDKAGTEGGQGAYTAGVLMHKMFDGSFVISHVARGHWGALEREKKIKALGDADGRLFGNLEIGLEQEPGSGGKESAEATVRNLAGKRVFVDRVTGSKEVRAEPFVAQCQNDNVRLVAGEWIHEFRDECEAWPAGARKDQVDAAAGAFNRLASSSGYTLDPFQPGFVDVE
jgi:predicted phage terminase large subunit-like protein